MRQTTSIVFGFLAVVAAASFPLEVLFTDDGDAREKSVSEESVPDLEDGQAWHCEDVTAQGDDAQCGIVHVCQSWRDTHIMALQISLLRNSQPVYRKWGQVEKTRQSLWVFGSMVWTRPLHGGKMECGIARDEAGQMGILFMIYHEDDPDLWAAQAFFPH